MGETGLHEVIMGYNRSRWSCNGLKNDICGLEWLEVGYTGCLMKPGPIRLRRPNFLELLRSFFFVVFLLFRFFLGGWGSSFIRQTDCDGTRLFQPTGTVVQAPPTEFLCDDFFWSIFHKKKIKKEKKIHFGFFTSFDRCDRWTRSNSVGFLMQLLLPKSLLSTLLI